MTAGLTVNSTSEPAINGTYAIDPATQGKIAAVEVYIMKAGTFPGGVSTYPWSDTSGTIHTFPNTATFQAWATAIADHVSAIDTIIATGTGSLPAATVTIA